MADLEIPAQMDDLCLARGDEVNALRPLFTGDVVEEVLVPVLGDVPLMVALVSHPCAMRAGPDLAPLLHVAPVVAYEGSGGAIWQRHFKVMPLGAVGSIGQVAIKLDLMTLVPSNPCLSG